MNEEELEKILLNDHITLEGVIDKQKTDSELRKYFELVNSESKQNENLPEYYIHNGELMRRWKLMDD